MNYTDDLDDINDPDDLDDLEYRMKVAWRTIDRRLYFTLTSYDREEGAHSVRLRAPRPDVPPAAGAVPGLEPGQVLRAQEQGEERGTHPHRSQDQPHCV